MVRGPFLGSRRLHTTPSTRGTEAPRPLPRPFPIRRADAHQNSVYNSPSGVGTPKGLGDFKSNAVTLLTQTSATLNARPDSESARADAGETFFKTPNAPPGRHFKQTTLPSLGGTGPILPEWLRKRFRRTDMHASR